MFKIEAKLNITELNKFYKRSVDLTTLGDSKPNIRTDYILVCACVENTGTHFYYNFTDFDYLFNPGNEMLICEKDYIDDNFTEVDLEDIMEDLR